MNRGQERDAQTQERVSRRAERPEGRRLEELQPELLVFELGARIQTPDALFNRRLSRIRFSQERSQDGGAQSFVIEPRDAGQTQRKECGVELASVALLLGFLGLGESRPVALLVVRISFGIRLGALLGHARNRHCGTHQGHDALELVQREAALPGLFVLGKNPIEIAEHASVASLSIGIARDEARELVVTGVAQASGSPLCQPFQRASGVGQCIREPALERFRLDLDVLVALTEFGDEREVVFEQLDALWIVPFDGLFRFVRCAQSERLRGVAGDHHEVPGMERVSGERQVHARRVRHVVGGVIRRLLILVHVSAQEREVSAVAGPTPVVDFTTEVSNALMGCVDQAHVPDL